MVYDVLVRRKDSHFTATVLGLPDCTAEAPTRSEAIRRVHAAAANFIAEGELVRIEIAPLTPPRPIISFAGMWADDDTFDDFVAAMAAYRKEVDADPSQP